jgi:hypothetical protein
MKRILFAAIGICFLIGSCHIFVGDDGDVFIAYSWVSVESISTDDPAFGPTIYNETYEDAYVGTWHFSYTSFDSSYWTGQYTIYRDEGYLLVDGDDIYFELSLYSFGPSFYEWDEYYAYLSVSPVEANNKLEELFSNSQNPGGDLLLNEHWDLEDSKYENISTVRKGNYFIVLEYSKLN